MAVAEGLVLAIAQADLAVGDVAGNTRKIIDWSARARDEFGADLVVFPELAVCGYPPEDLLFHAGLRKDVAGAIERIRTEVTGIAVLIGFPDYDGEEIYNSSAVFLDGDRVCHYRKHRLPNYAVFDEERYFEAGKEPAVFSLRGVSLGLVICEDIWGEIPMRKARAAGAECIVAINGSPYERRCQLNRERVAADRIADVGVPLVYVNMVGGQDELVFDGGSFATNADGQIAFRAPAFEEGLHRLELVPEAGVPVVKPAAVAPLLDDEPSVYKALVTGTRDYVNKHGFKGVVIGLSGGIDSAVVLAIACDALGPERVRAVMMPFRYTSTMSQEDAQRQADTLGVRYDVIPIEPIYDATTLQLEEVFAGKEDDVTEENIQARCRGLLLMAISNKTGWMLLTTGNKSEMAVGYATLYGDMAGGFAPIKDCPKSFVYRLARYRNGLGPCIPERVITRPPSAELRPDQKDSDSLPDYDVLDPILEAFIEDDLSVAEITERGYDRATVIRVLEMVKRVQTPPGASGNSDKSARVRSRLALSHYVRVQVSRLAAASVCFRGLREIELQHAASVVGELCHAELFISLDQQLERPFVARRAVIFLERVLCPVDGRNICAAADIPVGHVVLVLRQPVAEENHALPGVRRIRTCRVAFDEPAQRGVRLLHADWRPPGQIAPKPLFQDAGAGLVVRQALDIERIVDARMNGVLTNERF